MRFEQLFRVAGAVAVPCVLLGLACLVNACAAQAPEIENPFDFLPQERQQGDSSGVPSNRVETVPEPKAADEFPDSNNAETAAQGPPAAEPADAPATQPAEKADLAVVAAEGAVDELLTRRYLKAAIIDLDGPIFGRFSWYLHNRLEWAQSQGADLVIVRLTSPGGELETSLELARRLRDVDWATTVIYIPTKAISGGAILALGADRILMQNGALIGDAGPIRMGIGGQFEHAEEKVVSYLAEAISEIAKAKGRPEALAQAMVDRSLTIMETIDSKTGKTIYLTEQEAQAAEARQEIRIVGKVPETEQNRFLTLDAERARELGICEGVFASEDQFLGAMAIESVVRTTLTWTDKLVYLLNRPWLTGLLLIVGLIGLYLEVAAPGISVAGLTALCSFSIFFWSHALGGTSGWLEVLLFALGIICLLCELFVVPGFGVFGISGIALVILSLVMASQDFVIPESASEWTQLRNNAMIVLGSVFGVMLLFVGQLLILDSLPGLTRFQLSTPPHAGESDSGPVNSLTKTALDAPTPLEKGLMGIAESDLRPSGKVRFGNEIYDVISDGEYVDAGTQVEIIRLEGNRAIVRRRWEG